MAEYPVYRCTPDGRHFYCIEAGDRFIEIQAVGNRMLLHRVLATAYPERVRIMEMIDGSEGRYRPITSEVWEAEWRRSTDAS